MAFSVARFARRGLPQARRLFDATARAAPAALVPLTTRHRKDRTFLALALSGAAVATQAISSDEQTAKQPAAAQPIEETAGQARPDLPNYSLAEIAAHNTPATRIWVTYRDGVYDITDFMQNHPGGNKILLAAGSAVEPFWALYAAHKNAHVLEMLEQLRVGNIAESDRGRQPRIADPYVLDPDRGDLVVINPKPFNAQTPPAAMGTFITPNDMFFVRNHHPVPVVDPESFRLGLSVNGESKAWTLEQLKAMPQTDVIATIQCSGNRRSELSDVKGLQWTTGAISTAKWSGVPLAALLAEAGVTEARPDIYVTFEGLDHDMTGEPYSASITLAEALDPASGIIIAHAMGGEEIPRDHGFPLRVILPGRIGARSIKWLSRIVIGPEQSKCFFYQKDYKLIKKGHTFESFPSETTPPIMRFGLSSVIVDPAPGTPLPAGSGRLTVTGWAFSGEHVVDYVEVSPDDGKNWYRAALQRGPDDPFTYVPPKGSKRPMPPNATHSTSDAAARPDQPWAWVQWRADVPLPAERPVVLRCRATDVTGASQPQRQEDVWNVRGLMNNSWHTVTLS